MEKQIPVKKNQDITVDISGLSSEGQGVGRIDGYTVFIEGALPGERVEIKVVKVLKNYGFGKLLKVIKPAPTRIQPKCGIMSKCGGCQLQHVDYAAQLESKATQVKDAIERLGGLKGIKINDTIGMSEPWRYRNKTQLPVGWEDGVRIGFYRSGTHEIIDTHECFIQDEISDKASALVRDFIHKYGVSVYNEETGQGLIRHIMTRKGFKTGDVMVCLVINGESLPNEKALVSMLRENIDGLKSIVLNVNRKNTNVILGDKNKVIYGDEAIYDYIGQFKFRISPHSFFQVNPVQTEVLYGKALEYAGLTGRETVFDAYCGIGTISLFLSQKAAKVYGVEIVPQAIENAKENAALNKVENVEFMLGESEIVIPQLFKKGIKADVMVVDPPRKGCDERLLEVIASMAPERVVYVSCNPATLARDLKYLSERGYAVREVQPVDMFPHTAHVESVCLLEHM